MGPSDVVFMEKRRGPRTDPWVTPVTSWGALDSSPCWKTYQWISAVTTHHTTNCLLLYSVCVQLQLQESEDVYVQSEKRISQLKSSLDDKEREANSTAQKLEEVLAASTGKEHTIKQLEEAVQRYHSFV